MGLGIPRQPIRLVRRGEEVRAVGVRTPELDPTDDLAAFATRTVGQLGYISGYILKNASPSCGMERVKVYNENGMPERIGVGVYAEVLMKRLPLLPVEEEGRLGDAVLRENFIERVFVYHRWQQMVRDGLTAGELVEFHSDHKYLILAHDQEAYRQLGRLVADAGKGDLEQLAADYFAILMTHIEAAGDTAAACQRVAASAGLSERESRQDRSRGDGGNDRAVSPGSVAADRSDYTYPPSFPAQS